MKIDLPAACLVLAALFATPAHALDCAKASTTLEHRICADKGLQKADAAMGAAYLDLLRAASDADVRAALINSQRRWIAAREKDLGSFEGSDDAPDAGQQRRILLDATTARTRDLAAKVGGKPKFIVDALKQRASFAAYSGGPFGGYGGSCSFIPDQSDHSVYTYNCFGSLSVQNGDRVCTENQDFASYSMVERRTVADIVNGEPKVIAACTDNECPDANDDKDRHWNLQPTPEQADIGGSSAKLTRLDPDLAALDEDQDWLRACLTDKSFPTTSATGK